MTHFVWTRMQDESGFPLSEVIRRKEAERALGDGVFWWGIGNSLGRGLPEVAKRAGGTLPVLFSQMLGKANKADAEASEVRIWTSWKAENNDIYDLPGHVLGWSRVTSRRYALVCRSKTKLALQDHGPFTPKVRSQQVTALLEGDLNNREAHWPGVYHWGFRAELIEPWLVELATPRDLTQDELAAFRNSEAVKQWPLLVARLKGA